MRAAGQSQSRSILPGLPPSTGTSAANSRRQIPPRHSTHLLLSKHTPLNGRDALSPAPNIPSRETLPATLPPAPPLLPAPFPFPFHPRAPANLALPFPKS